MGFGTEAGAAAAAAVEPEGAAEDTAATEPGADGTESASEAGGTAGADQTEDGPQTAEAPKEEAAAEGQPQEERKQEKEQDREYAHFEPKPPPITDYYEVLQISRNADPETIHRVYRIMVARFHPDNPRTGDPERFQLLRRAYHVLSDPARRADYDRSFIWAETHTLPIFELKEFVDGVDGEKNRRLGILSLLYHRRRLNEQKPGVSVLDLEHRMGFPREYLNFTLWYLKSKGFVRFEDNSDYGVTVEGVDYLEANSVQNTIIRELLEAGTKGETGTSACGATN
ncbi:MAG TPA: DnaJ domain-containing protein [Bryobacteraceae bacterium]|nr:DnaJ domain-containing protein [Bryobacteraceae bacterium]